MNGLLCEMRCSRDDKLEKRNFCRRPGSCCLADGRLRDVTCFQRTLLSALSDIMQVIILFKFLAMHHPGKLFPRFLLFAAKNTTALLFCQVITSASSYWLSLWFVSLTEESIIYKDRSELWSFQFHKTKSSQKYNQETKKYKSINFPLELLFIKSHREAGFFCSKTCVAWQDASHPELLHRRLMYGRGRSLK